MNIPIESQTSRRERKKLATRSHIKAVASRLFREQGFENVTITQIAQEADVDVTTFWRHFRSKRAILCSDRESWSQELRAALSRVPKDRPLLDAAIEALVATPPVGRDELIEIRGQLGRAETSPETRAAILAVDDMIRAELATALAERLGVSLADDPRPHILSGALAGAAHWFSEQNVDNPVVEPEDAGLVLGKVIRRALA